MTQKSLNGSEEYFTNSRNIHYSSSYRDFENYLLIIAKTGPHRITQITCRRSVMPIYSIGRYEEKDPIEVIHGPEEISVIVDGIGYPISRDTYDELHQIMTELPDEPEDFIWE
jgi:hypothetical protein